MFNSIDGLRFENNVKFAIQPLSDSSSTISTTFDTCSGSRKRVAWPPDSFDLTDPIWGDSFDHDCVPPVKSQDNHILCSQRKGPIN